MYTVCIPCRHYHTAVEVAKVVMPLPCVGSVHVRETLQDNTDGAVLSRREFWNKRFYQRPHYQQPEDCYFPVEWK